MRQFNHFSVPCFVQCIVFSVKCLVFSVLCLVSSVQYVLCSVQSAAAERVTAQSFCNQLGKNLRKWTNFKLDDKDEDCIDNDGNDDDGEAVMMMGSSWRKAAMNLEMVDKRFLHFSLRRRKKQKNFPFLLKDKRNNFLCCRKLSFFIVLVCNIIVHEKKHHVLQCLEIRRFICYIADHRSIFF